MKAYPNEIRRRVITLYETGKNKSKISQELGLNYKTVSQWLERYKKSPSTGLEPRYSNCGSKQRVDNDLKNEIIDLKREHEGWGATYIRMKLSKKYTHRYIPSVRQMQRYFHSAGLVEKANKLPKGDPHRHWSKKTFHRVQVDAKEQIQTQDGEWNSYLTFTDECTGAVLEAIVFPL